MRKLPALLGLAVQLSRYNLKIVFANKFVYFVLASLLFFLLVVTITYFDSDVSPSVGTVYYQLLFPGILLVFYPTVFGIQNDMDTSMIETLFGIPDYSYKVWLARLALTWVIVFAMMTVLALLRYVLIAYVPILSMVYQIMFPIFFIGALSFMFSTLIRNGNGVAVVMVAIGIAFWIGAGILEHSKWNIFLNPFGAPREISDAVWAGIVLKNRIFLGVGTVLAVMYGVLNLQKRERFV